MGSNERASGFFRVPLHYPRYTRKDYEDMPEWKLDRVLAEYGLSANGDLSYKREFAMGAFLWPNFVETPSNSAETITQLNIIEYALLKKNIWIVSNSNVLELLDDEETYMFM